MSDDLGELERAAEWLFPRLLFGGTVSLGTFFILLVLKLAGVIPEMSWWIVTLTVWGPPAAILAFLLVLAFLLFVAWLLDF